MTTVITVMKSGGVYDHSYTHRLRQAVLKHSTVPVDFVCLTDQPRESYHVPMQQQWPGWWGKLEIFDYERFPGHCVFIDLDTVIRGNIDSILTRTEQFVMMRDHRETRANSCLMSWRSDNSHILSEFLKNPQFFADRYRTRPFIGDQAHIEICKFNLAHTVHYWQDLLGTDYFVNWTLEPDRHRSSAPVLWWTDGPKPHEIFNNDIIDQHWRNL